MRRTCRVQPSSTSDEIIIMMKETINLSREAVRLGPKKEGVSQDRLTERIIKRKALIHVGHRHIHPVYF